MVTIEKFVRCDCHKGTLDEIARSQRSGEKAPERWDGDYIPGKQSVFYECDSCGQVYKQDLEFRRGNSNVAPVSVVATNVDGSVESITNPGRNDQIQPYHGSLTLPQIRSSVPDMLGQVLE